MGDGLYPSEYVNFLMNGELKPITMGVQAVAVASVARALADAVVKVNIETLTTWVTFLRSSQQGITSMDGELAAVNAEVALDVRAAILQRFIDTSLDTPTYRTSAHNDNNVRYAGGILKNILSSDDFVKSDAHGIYVGDIAVLDQAARQWARLNYGAGGAAGGGGTAARVEDFDVTLEDSTGPRPAFNLPAGRWSGREFYPISELLNEGAPDESGGAEGRHRTPGGQFATLKISKKRPTRGIHAQHWSDAGLQVIARELGPAYTAMFTKLWEEAVAAARSEGGGSFA